MTPDPVLLVQGTHGYAGTDADAQQWWWPGDATHPASPWVREASRRGLTILGDPGAPFVWSTDLAGAKPRWFRRSPALTTWKAAGEAVREYCWARSVRAVQLVAHSHGGQVAAYAAARRLAGFRVSTFVTLATPVRRDMEPVYRAARAGCTWWEHVHGGRRDSLQLLGSLFDGTLGRMRAMPEACHNTELPDAGHHDVLDVAVWDRYDLWRFLR
jgi:hypothetical protein